MANIKYLRPSDNVAGLVTPTASAADATYPATFLVDLNGAKPAKLTTTTGTWSWDFGVGLQRVDCVALIHHNLTAGLEVRIQSSAVSNFSALQVNTTITIPAYRSDGFSISPWLDITGVANYSASGHRYWRINVVGTNAAPVAIGEVILGSTLRTLEVNLSWGATDWEDHPITEHRSDFGVSTIYDFGTFWRTLSGEVDTTDAGWSSIQEFARAARNRARPFLLIPDPAVNDAWFCRFAETRITRAQTFLNRNQVPLVFEEVARGLPL